MKQTALEFLLRELENKFPREIQDLYYNNKVEFSLICEQAKVMEKQQIIDAWIAEDNELQRMSAKQYYNETFNK